MVPENTRQCTPNSGETLTQARRARWRRLAPALGVLALVGQALGAAAAPDRDNTDKTGWWYLTNASYTDINAKVSEGYRPIDIEPIHGTSPMRFACTMVRKAGSYDKTGSWHTNVSATYIGSIVMDLFGQRLIDLEPYEEDGVIKYAYVAIENSGADFSPANWWLLGQTEQQIRDFATTNNARPIDTDVYWENGVKKYAAVFVANSGSLARDWTWMPDATPAQISSVLSLGKRIVQIEKEDSGSFNALIEDPAPGVNHQWWFYGWTEAQIDAFTAQYGVRLLCVDKYTDPSTGIVFTGCFINNLNPVETRSRDLLDAALIDGSFGFYCKQVNGPTLSGLMHQTPFEPASSLKILHHIHVMRMVNNPQTGVTLFNQIPYLGTNYDSCPNPNDPNVVNLPLNQILSLMLVNSDNEATYSVTTNFGGMSALNNTGISLGLTDTNVVHHIGCPQQPNLTSLVDLGRIHEFVSNGNLNPGNTAQFRSLMINAVSTTLLSIIDEEAASLNMMALYKNQFIAGIQSAGKGGNYNYSSGLASRSGFAWVSIPFKVNCLTSPVEFIYGSYYNNISNETLQGSRTALTAASNEQLREVVRAAMQSWIGSCLGDFNNSGGVTPQDIFDFLASWFRGDADINGDRQTTVQDIFDFLAHWFAGQ